MPKGKILVMDDDELMRELLEEILKQFGYDVEFAKDGGEAIDLYRILLSYLIF
ncbi:MAG TPA: hypothetical protein VHT73_14470 [Thermodesulfobacteriota bacterium]|nr:hypothetical protein [Thermodesulfobacteriota bacterium]